MSHKKYIKSPLESMLFVWGQPLGVTAVAEIFGITEKEAAEELEELAAEYEEEKRGIRLRRINKSYQLVTAEENV